jgi:hypothetical protein
MLAHDRVELAEFHSSGVVAAILFRQIHVRAFGAAHLNKDARAFFSHEYPPLDPKMLNEHL